VAVTTAETLFRLFRASCSALGSMSGI
jgi:hypothetical protein